MNIVVREAVDCDEREKKSQSYFYLKVRAPVWLQPLKRIIEKNVVSLRFS